MKKSLSWSLLTALIACASMANAQTGVSLPYSCDFETGAADWQFAQAEDYPNHWYRGQGAVGNDTYCLYVSSDGGVSNSYENSTGWVHAYLPVNFETAGEYDVSFRYSSEGEGNYDYMRVALLDEAPVAGAEVSSSYQYSKQLEWTQTTLTFTVSNPGIQYLTFTWHNDMSTSNHAAAIDDVQIKAVSCSAPVNVVVSANDNDYVVSWETPAPTSLLEYRIATEENWNAIIASGTSQTLPELESGTPYVVRVRAICGEGDSSRYSAENTFMSSCGLISLPYLESFEASSWNNGFLTCWTIIDGNGDGKTFVMNASSGVNESACAEYSYASNNKANEWLISPQIDLTGKSTAGMSFQIKAYSSSSPEKYMVLASTSGFDTSSFTHILQDEEEITETEYVLKSFDLSEFAGEKIYIAIKATSEKNQYYLYIDEFEVTTCPRPSEIAIAHEDNALTSSSAKIAFTSSANDNTVEYRAEGSDAWTVLTNQTSPVELPDLSPNTSYEVRIKAICGQGDESAYSSIMTFSTPCLPSEFPYIENFSSYEDGDLPDCWTIEEQIGNTPWFIESNYSGSSLNYQGYNQNRCNISSPIIDITDCDRDRLELELTYSGPYAYPAITDMATLFISTDNGITYDSIEGYPMVESSKTTIHIPLKDLVGDANSVRFLIKGKGYSDAYSGFSIYAFNVQHSPICFPPTHIVVEEVEHDRSLISWTAPEQGDPQYYEASWYKEGESESAVSDQTDGLANQMELPDLEQNTTYVVELSTMCSTEASLDTVFTFLTPYSCPAPTNLSIDSVSTHSIGIHWDGNGGPFQIEYKEASASEWINYAIVDENEALIEGLTDATLYDIRVRIICAENDTSLYATVSGNTPCLPQSIPYAENFENGIDGMPACWSWQWTAEPGYSTPWEINNTERKEGSSSLRFYSGYLDEEYQAMAISPALEFDGSMVYTLDFWIFRDLRCTEYGYQKESIKIFVGPNYDTTSAQLICHIHNNTDLPPVEAEASEDEWYHYSYTISGVDGDNFLLFYGIPEYRYNMYIDDLKITPIYETELALQEVATAYPFAAPLEKSVSVTLVNEGISDFIGDVNLSYAWDDNEAVKEVLTFTSEAPLYPNEPYVYTFSQKSLIEATGEHSLTVSIDNTEDPIQTNNTLTETVNAYEAASLPYDNAFDGTSEQEAYAVVIDRNKDASIWAYSTANQALQISASQSQALNDDYYTPGIFMQKGVFDYSFQYGALDEGKLGKLEVMLVSDFSNPDTVFRLILDSIADPEAAIHGSVFVKEKGTYMLRFHAYSDAAQSGLFVSDLSLGDQMLVKELFAEICSNDTYPFGEQDLSQSGTYYDTIRSEEADTLVMLNLTVNPAYEFNISESICEGDTLRIGNQFLTEAGTHTVSLKTHTGCDSIYNINLSIKPTYLFELDTAICEGSHIVFGGKTYTESGEYTEEYISTDNCDSIYHLILAINPLPEPPVIALIDSSQNGGSVYLTATTPEDSVRWYNQEEWIEDSYGKQYTPTENGFYHATAVNSCGESDASNTIEVKLTAAEGASLANAPAVYPNPASDNVSIRAQQDILLAQMHAQSGKLILTVEGNGSPEMTLPVNHLATGTYILKVQTSAGWFTYKIVKK